MEKTISVNTLGWIFVFVAIIFGIYSSALQALFGVLGVILCIYDSCNGETND